MDRAGKPNNVPKEMQQRFDEVSKIIVDFCEDKLNDEYKQICLQLCATLCRKRPSPIISGKANTWACGIVHAIGMVNFLFDSTQKLIYLNHPCYRITFHPTRKSPFHIKLSHF